MKIIIDIPKDSDNLVVIAQSLSPNGYGVTLHQESNFYNVKELEKVVESKGCEVCEGVKANLMFVYCARCGRKLEVKT